ncbi:MAG: GH36-type glycosyl hydrolase domain-containing protein [Bacillota bacterium]|jgi:cyclic beta-1,2-glucan synthetase
MPHWLIIILLAVVLLVFSRPPKIKKYREQQSRDAILSPEEMEKHVREIAKQHTFTKNTGSSDCLISRMEDNFRVITQVYKMLNEDIRKKLPVPPAAEWLLDNFYIVEEQVKGIKQDLIQEKCLKLNILNKGFLKGYPRVYALALELVSHLDGRIDEESLIRFIRAYQSQSILSMAELWALPMMLKMALIENIKNVCQNIGRSQIAWRKGEELAPDTLPDLEPFITDSHALDPSIFSLIEHLLKKQRREGLDTSQIYQYFETKLAEFDLTLDQVIQEEHREQASRQVAMGNSITSIRLLTAINWNEVFENLSVVEGILRQDPDGTYPLMDLSSRNYYRREVEKQAKKLRTSETNLARKALELAGNEEGNSKMSHIGYFLIGEGQNILYKKIRAEAKASPKIHSLANYLLLILAVTGVIVGSVLIYTYSTMEVFRVFPLILVGILVLIPASDIAINLIQRIITNRIRASFLPKLSYDRGITEEARTLVVVPTLLPDMERAEELVRQLEVHYLSNKEKNLFFALLGDFKDAEEKELPEDQQIREVAQSKINELNQKYANGENIFYLFLRRRTFVPQENRWMGWERKRGAIMELNRFLLEQIPGSFYEGLGIEKLPRVKYVITLDADTRLPLHSAKKLIGTISHPLNRPVFHKEKGLVTQGYGLIQPRISVSVESANKSLFTRIFAGQGGIDPYTTAVSDIYQDYFGEGIFTGKGIYDVEVFQQALDGAIPDYSVLSHDLLEGCYVRVGLATDVELVDAFPARYNSFIMRMHRWVRGDWQLIKWLNGNNPLTPLSKWKIIDNLRRSLVSPTLLILITLGLTVFPGKAYFWLLFSLITIGFPLLMGLVDFILYKHYKTEWKKCHGNMIFGIKAVLYQTALIWFFLPYQAYMMGDAAIRSLYRVFFSRKNMLEWVTAADAERNAKNDVQSFFRAMFPSLLYGLFLVGLVLLFRPENLIYALAGCLIWGVAPYLAYHISKVDEEIDQTLCPEAEEQLREWAKKIWNFYEDFSGAEDNFLPPDNFQENPPNGVAHRTSPTNIGFLLLAVLSARDFGFISTIEMVERLERTFDTIEKMKKWKGHLYNWYDTRTLEILRPAFISSVDSGNFVGFLIALKEGLYDYLNENSGETGNLRPRMLNLIKRINIIVEETQFLPLFDKQRQLFSIGYNVEEEKLINSYYDLLASEARITSFLAIARGEVPEEHWFRLGKSLTIVDGYKGLVSWSGTMFEYFMPSLIMKNYPNTLLDETYRFVIRNQMKYGEKRKVPWGTSESGFYAFDMQLNYQYKAFGVPDLGLKRGLVNDMVVSPYSTFLALPFDPQNAWNNLKRLKEDGIEGKYGLYEAVDYTTDRLILGGKKGIVQSYMAHHQGMSLVALNNYFHQSLMQERFHRDPIVNAGELLLQEKVPLRVIITKENKEVVEPFTTKEKDQDAMAKNYPADGVENLSCHLLSNGRYSMLMTREGIGYSWKEGMQVTRWRDRGGLSKSGFFIFIQNAKTHETWSATAKPLLKKPDDYQVIFSPHKGEFIRNDKKVTTHTEVTVSPEDHVEIREVSLVNHGEEEVILDVTSYLEVVLTSPATDLAHPVFSNLFVRTEFLPKYESILAFRRPRESHQPVNWAFHTILVDGEALGDVQYETDRGKFIGRGRSIDHPLALDKGHPLSNSIGPVLDPVLSLRTRVKINPGQKAKVTFVLGCAEDRMQAVALAEKYHERSAAVRAFELAWTRSQVEEGYLNLKPGEAETFQEMISQIIFLNPLRKRYQDVFRKNSKGQPSLWPYGISGDLPIVLVSVKTTDEMGLVKSCLKAHEYWRFKGFRVDLVIFNEDETGYLQPVQEQIMETVQGSLAREVINRPGGVFVVKGNSVSEEDRVLLFSAARLILRGEEGTIKSQLQKKSADDGKLPQEKKYPGEKKEYFSRESCLDLLFYNGYGGFNPSGKEYLIRLKEGMHTPLPWINVVANPGFGFIISESGGGHTWAENSRENKLTPWSNDPVSDPLGEIFYLRDEETGEFWSPTPLPIREKESYIIRHGLGYSSFQHESHGINQELSVFVPVDDPVKISLLKLVNPGSERRILTITYYLKPVLGVTEQITQQFIVADYVTEAETILLRNSYNQDFPGRVAFVATSAPLVSFTTDEMEFVGNSGNLNQPEALKREKLSGRLVTGSYPCSALQVLVELAPGEDKELVFLLGEDKSNEGALQTAKKYKDLNQAKKAFDKAKASWRRRLDTIQVDTPDVSLDIMINNWLLYQALSCRVWGRSAFYQSGGAFGFRDQLQDVLSLIYAEPKLVRNQILLHAAHQFVEGDVQHWWHPVAGDKGVRTRFSDDLLWLPFVLGEYIEKTGDYEILKVEVPFLEDELLKEGEQERYGIPQVSENKASIYEHCLRAIDRSLKFGEHGLPLMGTGDWNDGMSSVGSEGKGESVWLGWFIYRTLMKFIPLCPMMNDAERGEEYRKVCEKIVQNIEDEAWDGSWYRRAYFDDGRPLGSSENSECKIDSLAQTWAVITGAGRKDRIHEAMSSLENYLIKEEEGLILLLTPAFDEGDLNPGYIKGYVPGVRENGGQYTHAAIWVISAYAKLGMGDKAWALYHMINPINHSRTSIEAATYKVEPYVMAADVYAVSPHVGRGGWTWYTGAASWMYKVGLEEILGFKKRGDKLMIDPCIPKEWNGYRINYRYGETPYEIQVKNPLGINQGVKTVFVDGKETKDLSILLTDDGKRHQVEVIMG